MDGKGGPMKYLPFLLLTALLSVGPVFQPPAAAAPKIVEADAFATVNIDLPGAVTVTDSRYGGNHPGTLHRRENPPFRHPGFSHDRHLRGHDRRDFFGHDQRHFRGHDRRHSFGNFQRRDRFFPERYPYLNGYVPGGVTVCYRSGSVLVCYRDVFSGRW